MRPILFTTAVVATLTYVGFQYQGDLRGVSTRAWHALFPGHAPAFSWPPEHNKPYPDLQLVDQEGQLTRLSDFKGKIILVEPIGMPCQACSAFCGGHEVGGFPGVQPQAGLPALKDLARRFGRFDLSDDRIVKVYLLLYAMDMGAPTQEDAKQWADHFGFQRSQNEIVLAAEPWMLGSESYAMIPGVQLIGTDFTLRFESTGRQDQRHDLYRDLLPAVRQMLDQSSSRIVGSPSK